MNTKLWEDELMCVKITDLAFHLYNLTCHIVAESNGAAVTGNGFVHPALLLKQ